MTKKIKEISQLPKWFSMDNYDTESLDLLDWLHNFHVRYKSRKYIEVTLVKKKWPFQIEIAEEKIKLGTNQDYSFKKIKQKCRIHPFKEYTDRSVFDASLDIKKHHLDELKKTLDYHKAKYEKDPFYDNYAPPGTCQKEWNERFINNVEDMLQYDSIEQSILVEINMDASDTQIMQDFEFWLKNYRENTKKIKDINEKDMKKWSSFNLLQYIDLKLWEQMTDSKITTALLHQVLYPGQALDSSRIKTTLPKLMQEVLSNDFHRKLSIKASANTIYERYIVA